MKEKDVSHFISVAETAQLLGYSRQHVLRLIENGEIEAEKVGRSFVVDKKTLPGIFTEMTSDERKETEQAVKKVIKEYGEALKKLSKE